MNRHMSRVTALILLVAALLAGCGDDAGELESGPTASATKPSPVPSVDSSSDASIALRGDWHDPAAQWVVHFEEDGSFTEDFEGMPDFRSGNYEVKGKTVRLIGGDGNTDEGTIQGDKLVFELGTLVRQ